ncbi:MAG: PAS domain S-box protein [Pseudomonadota bacterium]
MIEKQADRILARRVEELTEEVGALKATIRRLHDGAVSDRSLFDNMLNGFAYHRIVTDEAGTPVDYIFLDANPAFERMTGLRREDIIGRAVTAVHPGIQDMAFDWIGIYGKVALTGAPVTFEQYFEPHRHWYLVSAYSPQIGTFAVTFENITERKNAESALRDSEEKFRSFAEHSMVGIYLIQDGFFKYVNPRFAAMFGYSVAECLDGMPFSRLVFDDDRALVKAQIDRRLSGDLKTTQYPFRGVKQGGEVFDLEVFGSVAVYEGRPAAIGTILDISERKAAQLELVKLAEAVRQAEEAVVITTTEGVITYANPAFERITGYRLDEVIGQTPRILKSGHHDRAFYQVLWETIRSGERWGGHLVNKRKDGTRYTAECSISPVKDDAGRVIHFVWISRDISRELDLEKRVVQSQKMEAIGALASGIAHDFNNILFPIMGLSEMLLEDITPESGIYDSINEIHSAAKRAGGLVKQILAFSRQSKSQKLPIRIQPIVKEVLKLVKSTIPSDIAITSHIRSDVALVSADPSQVHQIIMNLVTNAYHAVEEGGGTIHIRLEEALVRAGDPDWPALAPGTYACLAVSDTGPGVAPEIIGKIFEPYFTTKAQGKGTGLGLSVVYGIVKEFGGDVRVSSSPGQGATFQVCLPVLESGAVAAETGTGQVVPSGSERILLVDDEAPIINLVTQMLERLGYRVTARTSSSDALDLFRSDPRAFDLVITDMTMPHMTGDRLARELLSLKPDIPIIICTGFSERISQTLALALGIKGFLLKPVVKSEMAKTIRQVLDGV